MAAAQAAAKIVRVARAKELQAGAGAAAEARDKMLAAHDVSPKPSPPDLPRARTPSYAILASDVKSAFLDIEATHGVPRAEDARQLWSPLLVAKFEQLQSMCSKLASRQK